MKIKLVMKLLFYFSFEELHGKGRGGGVLAVSVLAFYSDNPSLSPADYKNERKSGRGWYIFKGLMGTTSLFQD